MDNHNDSDIIYRELSYFFFWGFILKIQGFKDFFFFFGLDSFSIYISIITPYGLKKDWFSG